MVGPALATHFCGPLVKLTVHYQPENLILVSVRDKETGWREVARFPADDPIAHVDAEACMRGIRRTLLEGEIVPQQGVSNVA